MNHRKYPRALLPALALCLLAATAMLVSPVASGQKGDRVAQEIGQVLESFETVTLDPAEVLRSARGEGGVTLHTARGDFDLVVEPFDIRSDNYRAVAVGADGAVTDIPRTPSNSFRGKVRGQEGTTVRLYLDGQKVQGLIITPSETFYVEPARDLSAAAGSKDVVFYAASAVRQTDASCQEVTLGGRVGAEAAKSVSTSSALATKPPTDDLFTPKRQADIATEADFEFFQGSGNGTPSVTATNNEILNIMTMVDGIYDAQLGVRINVVFQRVWTANNDPYTLTSTGSDPNILSEFADNYDASFGVGGPPQRDLTHLFTGKDIDGTTIGIAYTGVVCDIPDAAYGVSQSRFTTNLTQRVAVTAHEIGHNFGATHTSSSTPNCDFSNSLMNASVQNTQNFCQFSRDQITSHVTAFGNIPVSNVACLLPLTGGCNYAITPSSQSFPVAGGTGTVNVTSNCAWGVAEGATWVTFNSEAGTGNGSTGYTVAANSGNTGPRRTFVDIGGQQLAILQQASPTCAATATQISIGQTLNGTLATTDCATAQPGRDNSFEDLYTFTARAGQHVRIAMSTTGSPGIDTYLYLFGPDGTLIAENDDIVLGQNTNSRIPQAAGQFFELPQTGVYTIAATTFDDSTTGTYSLSLTDNASANTVSLSSSSYNVNEATGGDGLGTDGNGFRVVTVTRSGDTTGTATVDYATSDGTTGTPASKLKDYEQALGTLVFGPNETSKTFTVFIVNDVFSEPVETVNLTLSNPVGTTLGATSTATLTILLDDSVSGSSPVRPASFSTPFFVRQQYLDFLNREPDTSGFGFWQGNITDCGADEGCKEVKRINVSAAFFLSIEFQNTGYLVERTYKTAYGDTTSPNVAGTVPVIRLNEFLPDTQRIGQNVVVGAVNWEQQLEANKQAYMLEFVLRQRFLSAFPLTMTSAQFVDKLVANAGITLTTGERDALIAQLNSTADVSAGRAAVLRAVAENQQLVNNEKSRAFVLMQYFGYLRRNPDDAPDSNFAGWKFWLDKLNQFNGDAVAAEMVKAFLNSDEYILRFGN